MILEHEVFDVVTNALISMLISLRAHQLLSNSNEISFWKNSKTQDLEIVLI